jgi:hypothetical protein
MDEYIRQLTHDNEQLANQWPDVFDKLHKLSIGISESDQPIVKVKALDALADYVLADNEEVAQIKSSFVEITMKKLTVDSLPELNALVRIFRRVLEIPNTNNLLHFTFLQKFYYHFRLGEHLSEMPSVDLIDSILTCLQKHEFFDQNFTNKNMQDNWTDFVSRSLFSSLSCDANKLSYEQTMTNMRSHFQQLYR